MDGDPEGTGTGARRRLRPLYVLLVVVFVVYVLFRLVQGVVWLVQHV